ncbi:hypothetical protein [Lysobacter gummosus]|uniref:hypothetical protein n=1 Tax=Lysobacter gummosus TaxID=262324 RepID=UPI00363A07DD
MRVVRGAATAAAGSPSGAGRVWTQVPKRPPARRLGPSPLGRGGAFKRSGFRSTPAFAGGVRA